MYFTVENLDWVRFRQFKSLVFQYPGQLLVGLWFNVSVNSYGHVETVS